MEAPRSSAERKSLAAFITPHGFGHAARTAAILNEIFHLRPEIDVHVYTQVPDWFFADTLEGPFHYHCLRTDVGLAQKSALEVDLEATVRELSGLYPLDPKLVVQLAVEVRQYQCQAVLCDTAALGIAVAAEAEIPSVLIENFTWDWIYSEYVDREPRFETFIVYLKNLFAEVSVHIQTTPYCGARTAERVSHVVARKPRTGPQTLRRMLGLDEDARLVLITMGGIEMQYDFIHRLKAHPEIVFIVPAAADTFVRDRNLVLLPHHTPFYHPDLVHASNLVVGKVGYSTLAEVYRAGIPFAYVPRSNFRESPVLVDFINRNMPGFEIPDDAFMDGEWIERLKDFVDLPRIERTEENGADEIARWLLPVIDSK